MEELKKEAVEVWLEYGKTIVIAFGFIDKGGKPFQIETDTLYKKLKSAKNKEEITTFIKQIKSQTDEFKNMKFVGE